MRACFSDGFQASRDSFRNASGRLASGFPRRLGLQVTDFLRDLWTAVEPGLQQELGELRRLHRASGSSTSMRPAEAESLHLHMLSHFFVRFVVTAVLTSMFLPRQLLFLSSFHLNSFAIAKFAGSCNTVNR